MAISSALYSGISGLNSNGEAMSVIGNNIANANTNAFKTGRVNFGDIISESVASGSDFAQIGRGSQVNNVVNVFTQGSLQSTASVTDLALEGDGFFIVSGSSGTFYTRAGAFSFDKNGDLVNPQGYTVQGWATDANGNAVGAIQDINFANASAQPNATSTIDMTVNLDSRSVDTLGPFNVTNANATSNFATGMTVYDSLGVGHTITVYFTKTAPNTWAWNAVVPNSEHTAALPAGQDRICATGTLGFTAAGALNTEAVGAAPFTFDFVGGASAAQPIAFDFGDSIVTDSGTGLLGSTQFGADTAVGLIDQDGFAPGDLQGIKIAQDGLITGFFTNGQTQPLSIVAIANFLNVNGLSKEGSNLWSETFTSGQPVLSQGGAGGAGRVQSNSLEQSNVDLAQEFVNMITTQRGFQANSRTITVTDEMMAEIINIKR